MDLKDVEIFKDLNDEEKERLNNLGSVLDVKNGEILINEGEEGHCFIKG
jgi:hypothetical protein